MKRILFLLSTLEDEDIEWLANVAEKRLVRAQDYLIQVNVPVTHLFIVLDGCLTVTLGKEEEVIAEVRSGEVLGEVSLLDSRPPVASVVASEDSLVMQIEHRVLKHKLRVEDRFASRFYRALGCFLAHRQRSQLIRFGYGNSEDGTPDLSASLDDEGLDPDLLDRLSLVGKRFGDLLHNMGVETSAER